MPALDFDGAVQAYRRALGAFAAGDPSAAMALFSRRDDVTLANPLGPPRRGWAEVARVAQEAAAHFEAGSVTFEEVSRYATDDLGYVLQIERQEGRLAGGGDTVRISLRVTMVFRREDDGWKVVHRHADPITTTRSIATIIEP